MDKVLSLYQELNREGIHFYCWDIDGGKAATIEMNGQYGIFVDVGNISSEEEELVVIAHEGGHCMTGATHQVASDFDLIEQHETKAWRWAILHTITPEELETAVAEGYTDIWSLAEHFGVTEAFMRKTVCFYSNGNLADELYF